MPVDDRARLNLLRQLEAVLGTQEANTLMSHLPPVTWNELATKGDVRAEMQTLEAALRREIEMLGTSLGGEAEMLGTNLRSDMHRVESSLRTDLHVGFATLRTELVEAGNRQIKWMVTFAAAWSSLLVAAVRLIP